MSEFNTTKFNKDELIYSQFIDFDVLEEKVDRDSANVNRDQNKINTTDINRENINRKEQDVTLSLIISNANNIVKQINQYLSGINAKSTYQKIAIKDVFYQVKHFFIIVNDLEKGKILIQDFYKAVKDLCNTINFISSILIFPNIDINQLMTDIEIYIKYEKKPVSSFELPWK